MPYNCIVLAKQVPDTKNITGEAMTPEGTVNRAALPAIFNPEDLNALEMALSVKDRYGAAITVISKGPPSATEILRDSLYRGADRVILWTDRRCARSDTLATSYELMKAIEKVGDFDIVFCGRQAIDGDTAQVGPQVADKLGLPQITYVDEIIKLDGRNIEVRKAIAGGYETVTSRLPILLTITGAANAPRYPSCKRLMKYKRASTPSETRGRLAKAGEDPKDAAKRALEELEEEGMLIEEWNIDTAGADPSRCGGDGSATIVRQIESVVLTAGECRQIEPTDDGIAELMRELIRDHAIE